VIIKCNRARVPHKPTFTFNEQGVLSTLHQGETKEVECPHCGGIGATIRKAYWLGGKNTIKPSKGHAKTI